MPGNPQASVYIGNLDEKVDERALYEIVIQAGPVVEVYMPRDKETKRHKGYAFAEFSTETSAQYAVNLFSGLVYLHRKPLRFSISGQDKGVQQATPQEVSDPKKESDRGLLGNSNDNSQKLHVPASAFSPPVGYSNSPLAVQSLTGYPRVTVHSNYAAVGQRLDFSPLAYAQNYNARLVSLGQVGIQSQIHSGDSPLPYRLY